jgi:hydrogenase maturation protease
MKKTLVLGIGNTIRGDDGVGIETVKRLRELKVSESVDIEETSESGFALLSNIIDYDGVIIVDSIQTKQGKKGEIHRFSYNDLNSHVLVQCTHNSGIPTVLAWADKAGISLPKEIIFYAIEIGKCDVFKEGLSKNVEKAIPGVVNSIRNEIGVRRGSIRSL